MSISLPIQRSVLSAALVGFILTLFSGCIVDDRRRHHGPPPPPPHHDEVRADVIIR